MQIIYSKQAIGDFVLIILRTVTTAFCKWTTMTWKKFSRIEVAYFIESVFFWYHSSTSVRCLASTYQRHSWKKQQYPFEQTVTQEKEQQLFVSGILLPEKYTQSQFNRQKKHICFCWKLIISKALCESWEVLLFCDTSTDELCKTKLFKLWQ